MNELSNLILFKKAGNDNQLSLKTNLTFEGNTDLGIADSILERINEGMNVIGQNVGRYNSVVFYDLITMGKMEIYDLYSVPASYGEIQVLNDEEKQQLMDTYFAE